MNTNNYTAKSKWWRVVVVYEIIVEDENSDTDYWSSVGGEAVNFKLADFTNEDWSKLKEDLINWTSQQIEILCLILCTSKDFFEIKDITIFQSLKSNCYTHILNICDDNSFIDLIDYLDFIQLSGDKSLAELVKIQERLLSLSNSPIIESDSSTEYQYSVRTYKNFLHLIDMEIQKAIRVV